MTRLSKGGPPSQEALDRIPEQTLRTWPDGRIPRGFQPQQRWANGVLRFHAVGCWVAGGPGLPPGVCQKCRDTPGAALSRLLVVGGPQPLRARSAECRR